MDYYNPLLYGTTNGIPVRSKITQPADTSIVSLDTLKSHLGIYGDTSEDDYLETILLTGTDLVSNYIGYDVEETDRVDYYTDFEDSMNLFSRELKTSNAPVVKYYNTSNVLTTVDTSVYFIDVTTDPISLKLNVDQQWPSDLSTVYENKIEISYTSLLNEGSTQSTIGHAILMYCSELYEHRHNSTDRAVNKLPLSAERLLRTYVKRVV